MCIFSKQKMEILTDLLQKEDDFPIPVQEDFGGDVMIGWKQFFYEVRTGTLRSPVYASPWTPGRAMTNWSKGKPNRSRGTGIYSYGSKEAAQNGRVELYASRVFLYARIASWGTVLNFPHGPSLKKMGCMAQFAFPLEFYIDGTVLPETNLNAKPYEKLRTEAANKLYEQWSPYNVYVFVNGEKIGGD